MCGCVCTREKSCHVCSFSIFLCLVLALRLSGVSSQVCVCVSAWTSICMQRVCVRVCVHVHVEQQLRAGVGTAVAAVVGLLCVFGCVCCQFAVCQQ